MKVTLLNDTDGRENIGCRLTSSTLKRQLTDAFSTDTEPVDLNAFPWFFSHGPGTGRAWMAGCTWLRPCHAPGRTARFIAWLRRLAEREYGAEAVVTALTSDLVICHPEGSISDYHDAVRIMNLLSLPALAAVTGIPVFAMNGTFPLYPRDDRRYRLIHAFLQACRFAALRDRITAGHYGVTFMPDSAIMYPAQAVPEPSAGRPYVLITTGASQSKSTNLTMAREALRFCDDKGLKPLILTKKHKDLRAIAADVLARGGRLIEQATLDEAEHWLGQCALHIGGRYHMALFGLLLGVPSVLIPVNTHKNRWLADDFAGVELVSTLPAIGPAATRLHQADAQAAAIHQAVQDAREQFRRGLGQAERIVRERLRDGRVPAAIDSGLADALIGQLRARDVLSFFPFGIRVRVSALARRPAVIPASGGSCS